MNHVVNDLKIVQGLDLDALELSKKFVRKHLKRAREISKRQEIARHHNLKCARIYRFSSDRRLPEKVALQETRVAHQEHSISEAVVNLVKSLHQVVKNWSEVADTLALAATLATQ